MPGDPSKKLKRGERITVEAFNNTMDATRLVRERLQRTGARPQPIFRQSGIVLVRNETGSTVNRFGVMGINVPIIEPSADAEEFKRQVTFEADAPVDADESRFVILQEPLVAGGIGRAVVSGVTWVKVQINTGETGYTRAKIIDADTTKLAMSTSGPAEVLWKESGTGEKWACVRLGGGGLSLADPADFGLDYVLFWDSATESITWLDASTLTGGTFSGARVGYSADQTVSNNTTVTLAWDTESDPDNFDTNAYHDNSTNNERLTVPSAGYYHVGAEVLWRDPGNNSDLRQTRLFWSSGGTDRVVSQASDVVTSTSQSQKVSAYIHASSGDYFYVTVYQSSGASSKIFDNNYHSPRFWIHRVG